MEEAGLTFSNDFANFTIQAMKTFLTHLGLLFSLLTSAQDSAKINSSSFLHGLPTYDFPGGFGLVIGVSVPMQSTIRIRPHNRETVKFISAEMGGLRYPFVNTSVLVNAGVGVRFIRSIKHFAEVSFQQGVLRTVYDGKVYEVDAEGNVKEKKFFGRTYLTSGFSYSQNWSISKRNANLWFLQLKPFLWVQYPYNSFLKVHLSLQAGICYRLSRISF
jgi:hypothetical protein